jgi:hypothetical protein
LDVEGILSDNQQGQGKDWVHIILSNVPMRLLIIPAGLAVVALVYLITAAFPSLNRTAVALVTAFALAALFATFFGGRRTRRR